MNEKKNQYVRIVSDVLLPLCFNRDVFDFFYGTGVGERFMWTAFGANSRAFVEPFLIIPIRQMPDKHSHGLIVTCTSVVVQQCGPLCHGIFL